MEHFSHFAQVKCGNHATHGNQEMCGTHARGWPFEYSRKLMSKLLFSLFQESPKDHSPSYALP